MDCRPPLRTGLTIGLSLLLLSLGAAALGMAQMTRTALSPWLVLWTLLPLVGVPMAILVGYRLFGLMTARYTVDRNALRVRWGLRVEQAQLAEVVLQRVPDALVAKFRPTGSGWWPGCIVGRRRVEGVGNVEFLATRPADGMLIVSIGGAVLAISPPDVPAFLEAFVYATRLGSLDRIAPLSLRPDFFSLRVWDDRAARLLILLGLALPIALLGYIAVSSAAWPGLIPFGFDPSGKPSLLVPPNRLLFLPLTAGLCWLLDAALGSYLYRSERDRPLAYGVWGLAVVVGALFWGALLQLVAAA
jgi:Bacterial PH domain